MVKENRDQQHALPPGERVGIDAQDTHLSGAKERRQPHLTEVKSECGRNIQIAIDVMDEMKAPERRRDVVEAMPPPQRVIEQQDRSDEADRLRQTID